MGRAYLWGDEPDAGLIGATGAAGINGWDIRGSSVITSAIRPQTWRTLVSVFAFPNSVIFFGGCASVLRTDTFKSSAVWFSASFARVGAAAAALDGAPSYILTGSIFKGEFQWIATAADTMSLQFQFGNPTSPDLTDGQLFWQFVYNQRVVP